MKIKRIFLSLILIIPCFFWVSCGKNSKKKELVTKVDPTVSVSVKSNVNIGEGEFFIGDKLKDISLTIVSSSTDGIAVWKNEEETLKIGKHSYEYVFTPNDTEKYNTVTKTTEITATRVPDTPEIEAVMVKAGQIIYIGAKLSTVELEAVSNLNSATVTWQNPDDTFKTDVNSYRWVYNPNNSDYRWVEGTITISSDDMHQQTIESVEYVSNTNQASYQAFDSFDCVGLEFRINYNAGKKETFSINEENKNECTIGYLSGDCLHRGDKSVQVEVLGFSVTVNIDEVDYYVLKKPIAQQASEYSGGQIRLEIQKDDDSKYYSYTPGVGVDAGEYDLTVKILDSYKNDCRWEDSLLQTTTVKCKIEPAAMVVIKNEASEVYDKSSHVSTVQSEHAAENGVYYSKDIVLTKDNYESEGSTDVLGEVNAGTYTIYYYIVGDKNHRDAAGTIALNIEKATPTLALENCYSLYTGNAIAYSNDLVTISGLEGDEFAKTGLTFAYYSKYTESEKRRLFSAPVKCNIVDSQIVDYIVVVNYAGNSNYKDCSSIAKLFIDSEENGLCAKSGENSFVFVDDYYVKTLSDEGYSYSIEGSNKECTAYLEFKKTQPSQAGVVGLEFVYKNGIGKDREILTGKVGRTSETGYKLIFDDGTSCGFLINNDKNGVSFTISESDKNLKKWVLPNYLQTYTAQTISNENYNGDRYSTITVYNDYGTIRFSMTVNLLDENSQVWQKTLSGVVVCGFGTLNGGRSSGYTLTCYITDNTTGYKDSSLADKFDLYWSVKSSLKNGVTLGNYGYIDLYKGICVSYSVVGKSATLSAE